MSKEHAYAFETGYQAGLKASADERQDENDRMRELVERLFGRLLELLDENDELRKLVRDSALLLDATCDTYYEDDYHAIIDRARELRIEVDE